MQYSHCSHSNSYTATHSKFAHQLHAINCYQILVEG